MGDRLMTLIFTNEFNQLIDQPVSPFDRSYIKSLAMSPNLIPIRDRLESIIAKYPVDKRNEMINLIRSFSDIECLSRISELYVFDNLFNNFDRIDIEPPLAIIDNKTPDFWVNNSLAFEVATLFEQSDPHEYSIIETLNSIKSEVKVLLSPIRNIPRNESPKLREIRDHFVDLFQQKTNIHQLEPFVYQSSQDILISGQLYKANVDRFTVGSIMTPYGFDDDDPDYKKSVRKTIKDKTSKYKKLSEHGYPFVLVLYNLNDNLDNEEFDEIIFGDIGCYINNGQITEIRQGNMMFHPNKYTSLSAILIKDYTTANDFFLFENPYAKVPITQFRDVIIKAFNVKVQR